MWEVITTVGYGDRGIGQDNLKDMMFTVGLEFFGIFIQAVLINVMADFIGATYEYEDEIEDKL